MMANRDRDQVMRWFDLWRHRLLPVQDCQTVLQGAMLPEDICRPAPDTPVAVRFEKFSDGRGFTLARHLRESGFAGPLVACGSLIPDQADFLRRCGFTHVEIHPAMACRWRRSLALAPQSMQHVLSFQRSRGATDPQD